MGGPSAADDTRWRRSILRCVPEGLDLANSGICRTSAEACQPPVECFVGTQSRPWPALLRGPGRQSQVRFGTEPIADLTRRLGIGTAPILPGLQVGDPPPRMTFRQGAGTPIRCRSAGPGRLAGGRLGVGRAGPAEGPPRVPKGPGFELQDARRRAIGIKLLL